MGIRLVALAVALAILAAPLATEAQPAGKVYRVGLVAGDTPVSQLAGAEPQHPRTRQLIHALRAFGWVEGQNLILERRSAEGRYERYPEIMRELVELKCDVIMTVGNPMTRAAMRATTTVPIVISAPYPVESGLVASLARPGGNVTGYAWDDPEIMGKKLELLREVLPKVRRVAVLSSRAGWDSTYGRALRAAAVALGLTLFHAEAAAPNDFTVAFGLISRERPDAIFVMGGPFYHAHRHRIIDFTTRNRFPLMGNDSDYPEAGALMSYESRVDEVVRILASFVDRILRGAKPADLPIERSTKFELVINLKTAKALGLTIPPLLLQRADEVIE
jgi:putative ABC transport system substrate-binding protein